MLSALAILAAGFGLACASRKLNLVGIHPDDDEAEQVAKANEFKQIKHGQGL